MIFISLLMLIHIFYNGYIVVPQYLPGIGSRTPCRCSSPLHTMEEYLHIAYAHLLTYFIYLLLFWGCQPQARGQIRAVSASLCHSHSNGGSKLHLWLHHSSRQILNPLSETRDQTRILMDTSQIHFCWAATGTLLLFFCFDCVYCVIQTNCLYC